MNDVVFFKSTAQKAEECGKKFVFTDGHGIMALTDYYNELEDLGNVPWNVVNAQFWTSFPDGRRERQSEFMILQNVEWNLIETIGVYNSQMKILVESIVSHLRYQPSVEIKTEWFF